MFWPRSLKTLFANHATVFILRGLLDHWKQPVDFTFCPVGRLTARDCIPFILNALTRLKQQLWMWKWWWRIKDQAIAKPFISFFKVTESEPFFEHNSRKIHLMYVLPPPPPMTFENQKTRVPCKWKSNRWHHEETFYYGVCECWQGTKSHVQRTLFLTKILLRPSSLSKFALRIPHMCLDSRPPKIFFKNRGQKVKITLNFNHVLCFDAAFSRQSAANQHRVFDVIYNSLWVIQRIFPIWEHKRIAIKEQFDESCMRIDNRTHWLFS